MVRILCSSPCWCSTEGVDRLRRLARLKEGAIMRSVRHVVVPLSALAAVVSTIVLPTIGVGLHPRSIGPGGPNPPPLTEAARAGVARSFGRFPPDLRSQ